MSSLRPVVAVALLTIVGAAGCSTPPQIDVEHKVAKQAPRAMSPESPAIGTYREVWHREIARPLATTVIGGSLVTFEAERIQAYDARTGKPTWHYAEPGRQIQGWASTGSILVMSTSGLTEDNERSSTWHTVGLDAGTGELRWEVHERRLFNTMADGLWGKSEIQDGVVAASARADETNEIVGIDAETGDDLWRIEDLSSAEKAEDPDSNQILTLIDQEDERVTVAGMDPRNGRWVWRREYADPESPTVSTVNGMTLIRRAFEGEQQPGDRALGEVIDVKGETVTTTLGALECSEGCRMFHQTGRVLVLEDRQLAIYELPSLRRTTLSATHRLNHRDPYYTTGDELLALTGSIATSRSPLELTRFNLRGVRIMPTPMPFSVEYLGRDTDLETVAVGGGMVYMQARSTRDEQSSAAVLWAFTTRHPAPSEPGLAELGGVAPADWPDACEVIKAVAPKVKPGYGGEGAQPFGDLRVGPTLIRNAACIDSYLNVFEIVWVSATEQEADELFRKVGGGVRPDSRYQPSKGGGYFRVGRIIAHAQTYATSYGSKLIPAYVEHLKALQK